MFVQITLAQVSSWVYTLSLESRTLVKDGGDAVLLVEASDIVIVGRLLSATYCSSKSKTCLLST